MSTLQLPQLGLGVYLSSPGSTTYNTVLSGLKLGYRHIDTAEYYANESDVGRAVRDSGIPRQEIFITTKMFTMATAPAGVSEEDFALQKVKESMAKLDLGYIDLMLLHSPHGDRIARWRGLERAVDQGLCRFIGVSNFGKELLQVLLSQCRIKPLVNQIEVHVFLQRKELCKFCEDNGVIVEAYSPLCKAKVMDNPVLVRVAKETGKTVAQVMLRYLVEKKYVILPKSDNPKRQLENAQVFDFQLSAEQTKALDALEAGMTTGWDPTTITE
ncbi:hypothetical protein BASA81_003417 [Batrachochytrium salamandrivorans]|nr:hypothetical protein BASA81_003417 [Batrachochytrium salamandrivorans]